MWAKKEELVQSDQPCALWVVLILAGKAGGKAGAATCADLVKAYRHEKVANPDLDLDGTLTRFGEWDADETRGDWLEPDELEYFLDNYDHLKRLRNGMAQDPHNRGKAHPLPL